MHNHGTHNALDDPRNENVLISINGELIPRPQAKISVFDSGFLVGDGVWEGMRVHAGSLVFAEEHMDRLEEGAQAIGLEIGLSRKELLDCVEAANLDQLGDLKSTVHGACRILSRNDDVARALALNGKRLGRFVQRLSPHLKQKVRVVLNNTMSPARQRFRDSASGKCQLRNA